MEFSDDAAAIRHLILKIELLDYAVVNYDLTIKRR
jgi:hypothetical protein